MERLRRLGVAARVRAAGLPADYPHDVAFRTTLTGRELARIPIPPSGERYTATAGPDTRWATPEPPHRVNQTFLEPLLARHVAGLPHVTLLSGTRYEGFRQDDDGVSATVADALTAAAGGCCAPGSSSAPTAGARRSAGRSARGCGATPSSSTSSRPASAPRACTT